MMYARLAVMVLCAACSAPEPPPSTIPAAPIGEGSERVEPTPTTPRGYPINTVLGPLEDSLHTVDVLNLSEQEALVAVTTLGDLHFTHTSILRTTDAGLTWTKTYEQSGDWTEWASAGQTVWWTSHTHTGGRSPHVMRSVDGGVTWMYTRLEEATGLPQPRHARYRSLTVRTELQAQVLRDDPTGGTERYWSTLDGGQTWALDTVWEAVTPAQTVASVRVRDLEGRRIVQRRDGTDWWTIAMFSQSPPSP